MAQISAQLQETATLLSKASQAYSDASNNTGSVSADALASGMDLTQHWQGKAPQNFMNSLGRLADDTGKATEALLEMSGILNGLSAAITANLGPIKQYETAQQQGATLNTGDPYLQMSQSYLPPDLQANTLVLQHQHDQALHNIYDAANAAAGELEQITYVGTCSSIVMNGIGDWSYIISSLALLSSAFAYLTNSAPPPSGGGGGGNTGVKGKLTTCAAYPTNFLVNFLASMLLKYPKMMTGMSGKILASSPGILSNLVASLKKNGISVNAVDNPQFIAALAVNFLAGSVASKIIGTTQNKADEICAANPGVDKNQLKTAIQIWIGGGFIGMPISLGSATIISMLLSPSSPASPPTSTNTYVGDYHGYHIYEIGTNEFVAETNAPTQTHTVAPSITQNPAFQGLINALNANQNPTPPAARPTPR